jgi:hypothetical protein
LLWRGHSSGLVNAFADEFGGVADQSPPASCIHYLAINALRLADFTIVGAPPGAASDHRSPLSLLGVAMAAPGRGRERLAAS